MRCHIVDKFITLRADFQRFLIITYICKLKIQKMGAYENNKHGEVLLHINPDY